MSDFLFAPAASADLDEIWDYYAIELQIPDTADSMIDEIAAGGAVEEGNDDESEMDRPTPGNGQLD